MSVSEKMTAIADNIRAKTGGTERLTLDEMAEGIQEVFDVGRKSEYDRFWDAYQENGNRTHYGSAFCKGWTVDNFKPKYSIAPVGQNGAGSMFNGCQVVGDLVTICEAQGITIDFSKATYMEHVFYTSKFTRVGVVDVSKCDRNASTFAYAYNLKTIDKLVVSETTPFYGTFASCTALEDMVIEGAIGVNGLNLQWSTKLTRASIESIINALSTKAVGLSVTLSKTAVNNAFTDTEWATLVNTRPNWTINLV